jgi:serine/threonine-protein kinase ATR
VPFRLTQNLVDALGVTGVEGKDSPSHLAHLRTAEDADITTGVFRRASEVTMRILRENKDSLMSVLESFVHDPLVEWTTRRRVSRPFYLSVDSVCAHSPWARQKGSVTTEEQDLQTREARKALEPISRKLKGLQTTSAPVKLEKVASWESQVESLVSLR